MNRLAILGVVLVLGLIALFASLRAFAEHFREIGYSEGYAARDAEARAAAAAHQAKLDAFAATAADAARDLAEAEALTATLLEELADEASRDPAGLVLSPDSVRRLNAVAGYAAPGGGGAADPGAP